MLQGGASTVAADVNRPTSTGDESTQAKIIPLRASTNSRDRPGDDLDKLAGEVGATLGEMVATADAYDLEVSPEVRYAAKLLSSPQAGGGAASTSMPRPGLSGADSGASEVEDAVLGLTVTTDGRLALAPVSLSRREVLVGSAALLTQLAGLDTGGGGDKEAIDRLQYVTDHPRALDTSTVADLQERMDSLIEQYDRTPSASLLPAAGQYHGQVRFLREQARADSTRQDLLAVEAQSATLMGQLVWDGSQRREHATAVNYYDHAISAAHDAGEKAAEAYARLRKSYVALYGELDPNAGLSLTQHAASLADDGVSAALTGLAQVHAGEAYAMLGERRHCEEALGAAEVQLGRIPTADPAYKDLSYDRIQRVRGSCYLSLGSATQAESVLGSIASRLSSRQKSKSIVLGNLALACIRQHDVEQAAAILHRAIDLLELTRGGGGLNVVFTAVREFPRQGNEAVVGDLHDRLLALMAAA